MQTPAVIIAGTHSGSGKTTVTLAILAALVRRGLSVQAFKVGPDFIDPGHHARITGRPGRNLDTWLLDRDALAATYRRATQGADIAVIEGVMGLFDGVGGLDEAGSAADLARLWNLPVILVVDARGLARSIVPLVLGFANFDAAVRVVGVVANKVGGPRPFDDYLLPGLKVSASGFNLSDTWRDDSLAIPSRHSAPDGRRVLAWRAFAGRKRICGGDLDLDWLIGVLKAGIPVGPAASELLRTGSRVLIARAQTWRSVSTRRQPRPTQVPGAEIIPFSLLETRNLLLRISSIWRWLSEVFAAQERVDGAAVRRFHAAGG